MKWEPLEVVSLAGNHNRFSS